MTLPFARFKVQTEMIAPVDGEQRAQARALAHVSINANSSATVQSYLSGLEIYNMLFERWLDKYPASTLTKLIDFILPAETVPLSILDEARAIGSARYDVFFSGDWITAGEWFQLSGTDKKSPDLRAQQYLRDRLIFSIRHGDVDYFPIYGLDVLNNYQPVAGLHEIIELLSLHKDGWAFAFWFASPNSYLGDKAPKDLIQSDTHAVIAAALRRGQALNSCQIVVSASHHLPAESFRHLCICSPNASILDSNRVPRARSCSDVIWSRPGVGVMVWPLPRYRDCYSFMQGKTSVIAP